MVKYGDIYMIIISKNCLKIRNSQIPPWQKNMWFVGNPLNFGEFPYLSLDDVLGTPSLKIQLLDKFSRLHLEAQPLPHSSK